MVSGILVCRYNLYNDLFSANRFYNTWTNPGLMVLGINPIHFFQSKWDSGDTKIIRGYQITSSEFQRLQALPSYSQQKSEQYQTSPSATKRYQAVSNDYTSSTKHNRTASSAKCYQASPGSSHRLFECYQTLPNVLKSYQALLGSSQQLSELYETLPQAVFNDYPSATKRSQT